MRVTAVAIAFALTGCSVTDPGAPRQLTSLPRELTAAENEVSLAANQFALTLFNRLSDAQPDSNIFVSPLSVSFSLGMTMNGATAETLDQMRETLGFGARELSQINQGYSGLMSLEAGLDPSTTFQIANSVWYRDTEDVRQDFVATLEEMFEAEVRASPFDATTITQVNDWVSRKTNGRIPKILEEIRGDDVMFLINAIYFKGSWRDRFDPALTADAPFQTSDGATQTVKMMNRPMGAGGSRLSGTSAVQVGELVYGNGAFVMTILLPHDGDVNALAATLDTATWASLVGTLGEESERPVSLPKFTMEYERQLKEDLIAIGMHVPFDDFAADFSRMSPQGTDWYIAFVKHKTFVLVNEEGTEAAAVTNTGIREVSMPACLCVDRPFIFAIRERFSGTILFMGKILRIPS